MEDIQNFYERSIALLASQFQIKNADGSLTNFMKVIQAISNQAQVINEQLVLLSSMRWLISAQGVQLDGIGEIVGLERVAGQSDEDYRTALQFQIFVNGSAGRPEDVIKILNFITQASRTYYLEVYPAAYILTTNGLIFPDDPSDLVVTMQRLSPAGVQFLALIAIYDTNPFVFSSDPIVKQLYVAPDPLNMRDLHPFQVDPGSGLVDFDVQTGETINPDFGGGFAEAIANPVYPDYIYDNEGAGQLAEYILE